MKLSLIPFIVAATLFLILSLAPVIDATSTIEIDLVGVDGTMATADHVVAFTRAVVDAFATELTDVTVAELQAQEFHEVEEEGGNLRRGLQWSNYHYYSNTWAGLRVRVDGRCGALCNPDRRLDTVAVDDHTAFEVVLCEMIMTIPDAYFAAVEECHVTSLEE